MYELVLFAGGGGGILAGKMLGWRCIGAVEIEEYQRAILLQRQNDGALDPFPVWDDVKTFREDNPECSEYFAMLRKCRANLIISGGFPCQDISVASKGEGINGARSGLAWEYLRIIREIQPAGAYMENSPALTNRGLGELLAALSEVGYHAIWGVLGAASIGHCTEGKRIWILAYEADQKRWTSGEILHKIFNQEEPRRRQFERAIGACLPAQDDTGRRGSADGMAEWVVQLETLGNGQVPAVAAAAFTLLQSIINK